MQRDCFSVSRAAALVRFSQHLSADVHLLNCGAAEKPELIFTRRRVHTAAHRTENRFRIDQIDRFIESQPGCTGVVPRHRAAAMLEPRETAVQPEISLSERIQQKRAAADIQFREPVPVNPEPGQGRQHSDIQRHKLIVKNIQVNQRGVGAEVQGGDPVRLADQVFQIRVASQIDGRNAVAVEVQVTQLGQIAQIKCAQMIAVHFQGGKLRIVSQIKRSQLIVSAEKRLQFRILAQVQGDNPVIAAVQAFHQPEVFHPLQRRNIFAVAGNIRDLGKFPGVQNRVLVQVKEGRNIAAEIVIREVDRINRNRGKFDQIKVFNDIHWLGVAGRVVDIMEHSGPSSWSERFQLRCPDRDGMRAPGHRCAAVKIIVHLRNHEAVYIHLGIPCSGIICRNK